MNSDNELEEFTDFEEIVYGFQGRRLDSETNGLMYFRNRYYNPKLGRFLQRDPKGYIDSYGLYESFSGNPYGYNDSMGTDNEPTGLTPVGWWGSNWEKTQGLDLHWTQAVFPATTYPTHSNDEYLRVASTMWDLAERGHTADALLNFAISAPGLIKATPSLVRLARANSYNWAVRSGLILEAPSSAISISLAHNRLASKTSIKTIEVIARDCVYTTGGKNLGNFLKNPEIIDKVSKESIVFVTNKTEKSALKYALNNTHKYQNVNTEVRYLHGYNGDAVSAASRMLSPKTRGVTGHPVLFERQRVGKYTAEVHVSKSRGPHVHINRNMSGEKYIKLSDPGYKSQIPQKVMDNQRFLEALNKAAFYGSRNAGGGR